MAPVCFTEQEILNLIEMVHSRECLWDIKSKKYRSSILREQAWKDIGAALNITGTEAYKRFRSIRDKYRRELKKAKANSKSGSECSQGTLWPFFNHLHFLDEMLRTRRSGYKPISHPSQDTYNQINDSTEAKFDIFTITSVSDPVEDASMEKSDNEGVSADGFPSTIKMESPLSLAGSSINDDEEFSSASMLSKTTPRVRTPSPRQSSSPINKPKRVRRRRKNQTSSLEYAFSENTDKLISAISNAKLSVQPKPFDDVMEFVRKTLVSLPQQESKRLEKEIMASCIKYRYK